MSPVLAATQNDDLVARALENSSELIALGDNRDRITYANAAFLHTLGYSFEQAVGQQGTMVLSPRNAPEVMRRMRSELERSHNWHGECLYKHRDGTDVAVSLSTSRILDEEGQVLGTIGIAQDIRQRHKAEAELRENDQRFRQVADNLPQALFVRTTNPPRILYVSPAFERIWGRPRQEILSDYSALSRFMHPDDRERVAEILGRAAEGIPVDLEYRVVRPNGEVRHAAIQIRPLFDQSGKCDRVVGIVDDVTEKRAAAAELSDLNRRLQTALAAAEAGARENAALTELVEMLQSCHGMAEACQIAEQVLRKLFPDADGCLALMRASRNVLETRASWGAAVSEPVFAPDECWALRRGKSSAGSQVSALRCGHAHAAASICVPLSAQGDIFGLLCQSAVDEAALPEVARLAETAAARIALALANVRLRETLRDQSIRDPLTGLYNRRFMESTFERELERAVAKRVSLSVAVLDLDHFKRFNDTFGHNAGDLVLREVAEALRGQVRAADCCCRYGGEEFLVLLHETSLTAAQERLEDLRKAVKGIVVGDRGQTFGKITISAGLASYPDHATGMDALIKAADAALYRAKEEGRDRLIVAASANS